MDVALLACDQLYQSRIGGDEARFGSRSDVVEFGIFETVFERSTLEQTYRAVSDAGYRCVQCHIESAGCDPWTEDIPDGVVARIRQAASSADVRTPAVSGTFNMAHPKVEVREEGLAGFARVVSAAAGIGAHLITICTGTRNTSSMWRHHPDNASPDAWSDMVESVEGALGIAERHDLTLVVEPEPANIVSSAARARALLDQIESPRLKIVLDPANIVLSDRSRSPKVVLEESFDLLRHDIVFAHAKDLDEAGEFCAAGTGIVPWARYWDLLRQFGYDGDVIFHTLTEADIPKALSIVNQRSTE
jgi:sugar phosphate isomerase/epimerase